MHKAASVAAAFALALNVSACGGTDTKPGALPTSTPTAAISSTSMSPTPPCDEGCVVDHVANLPWSIDKTYWFPTQPPEYLEPPDAPVSDGTVASYDAKCSGGTPNGKYLGVRTKQWGHYTRNGGTKIAYSVQEFASYTCI